MAASHSYANILKQQFSLAPIATMASTAHNRPPRKRQTTQLDYDSDKSAKDISTTTKIGLNKPSAAPTPHPTTRTTDTTQNTNSTELLTIKDEIQQLKTILATAVAQITQALASLPNNNHTSSSDNDMDTDATTLKHELDSNNPTTLDLLAIINELKTEILNFTKETRTIV